MLNIRDYKRIILSVAIILLISVGTGAVLAYLSDKTDTLENSFIPGEVSCQVVESFDSVEKKDVSIKNTGNTKAYIRAAVMVNWQSDSDSAEILAKAPVEGVDYELTAGDSLWVKGDDGFWYYSAPVAAGDSTNTFIQRVAPLGEAPEGYSLSVKILSSAIQATPVSVVEDQWGVITSGGRIVP